MTQIKNEHRDRLERILQAIQNETVPMPGHSDPLAINDCWNEVYYEIEKICEQFHDQGSGGKGLDIHKKSLELLDKYVSESTPEGRQALVDRFKDFGSLSHIEAKEPTVSSDNWIKCSDRLPDNSRDVLVSDFESDIVSVGMYLDGIFSSDRSMGEITHWREMPLPPKPTEQ